MAESSLVRRLGEVVAAGSARVAVDDARGRVAFDDLAGRIGRVAHELHARGLNRADDHGQARIALLAEPGASWVAGFFGIVLSGGAVVPLSPLHPEPEQRWFVEAARCRALLVSESCEAQARRCSAGRPLLRIDTLAAEMREPFGAPATRDDDTALILFTSGTTGRPKGALLTHENVAALARLLKSAWGFREQDCLLHTLPLHHLHGVGISLMVSFLAGARTHMLERFDAPRVWEALADATVLMGVPTQHKKLFDAFDAADTATQRRWERHALALRLVTSGSAALAPAVGERWRTVAGQYPLERYGMTEVGIALSNPLEGLRLPGTCGVALPGMEVRIVSDAGTPIEPGEAGEIQVRGPTVFEGYDGDPKATQAAFRDGWFLTGDIGTTVEHGYVKILGRSSVDILKSGGYKLSALEIEDALREHEAIADVSVVGVPDETWGEMVVAAVTLEAARSGDVDESAVRRFAKERLAPYKVPKRVLFFDELPRTALGKVTKPELARQVRRALDKPSGGD